MALTALALLAVACADNPAVPDMEARKVSGHGSGITVMTRNMYVGADVDIVIGGDPNQIPLLVAQAFQQMLQTNYPLRASLLADEIARTQPHLVGLQEVSLIRIQDPGDFLAGNPAPATTVVVDFLPILMAELEARGLDYRVVQTVQNTDVELPMVTSPAPTFADVRLTDYDAILAREDVATANTVAANFQAVLPVNPFISIKRGYVAADARVNGRTYRFVNTHLESATELIRGPQADELIATFAGETKPLIMVGDFNSDAETLGPTYQKFGTAGYADAWLRRTGTEEQPLTCCHVADLSNTTFVLDERLDIVFTRNMGLGPAFATVFGDDPGEKSAGLWASDHAGVAVRFPGPPR
jgi:hypothetical protein